MNYKSYYYNYLNIDSNVLSQEKFIYKCNQRKLPICFFYYHYIIYTKLEDIPVISICPDLYDILTKQCLEKINFFNEDDVVKEFQNLFKKVLHNFSVRKMYRMYINNNIVDKVCLNEKVIQLNESHKNLFFNTLYLEKNENIKEYKWNLRNQQINEGRIFVIIKDNMIVSQAVVSDINFNGGNISVWTSSNYIGRGYGKAVVLEAARWCIENDIIPIYLVDRNNVASLNLAKSIGFMTFSEEIIISKVIK